MAAYSIVISILQTLNQRNPEVCYSHTAEALDSVRSTAEYFQNVLENASNSRFDTEKIKYLEETIRVSVSYAEDVVEMKISQIIKGSSWTFEILQHQDLLPLVEKMDTTKKQVMEIVSHHADQVLELSGDSLFGTSFTRYPMLEDDIVQGLDDDLEIIINRLKGQPRDLDIVTIPGMGGIGKTTLARKAYDHLPIRYHFDILAWVTISQEFRGRNVLLEALQCILKRTDIVNAKNYDKMDDNKLAELVQKNLKGQRYLFVVDDIWSTDVWDSLRRIFPDSNNRSRVLLTTRETEVAMYANSCSPHKMRLLSLENGWRLLCDKVFGPKRDHPHELEEIGKVIVEKCQGLPLAISVIAGHLSKIARTLECWKDVAQNLTEIIASHPDKCLGVLGLSYHHLPNRLKPCFLSMGDFPEDFQVETQILIQIWIAEGFIIRTFENGKTLEEVAIDYLEDLISRNLIQARKRRFNGEIKTCGIHDILREFCLIEAEMTKHMHVERTRPTLPTQRHNASHFSFQARFYSFADFSEILPTVARSIFLFSHLDQPLQPYIKLLGILPIYHHNHIIHDFFSRFDLLRVLAIFNTDVWFESFPLVITTLFHLRYLQFPFHVKIPGSISELQNLQTLICSGHTLPREIWMMKNLRYIRLEVPSHLPSPRIGSLVTGMPNLQELSGLSFMSCSNEVFSGILNLKRLVIHLSHIPKGIPHHQLDMSGLTKLKAFKLYGAPYLRDPIKRFGFPTSLRRLSLSRCCHFDWADVSTTVMMLPNLEVLKLIFHETLSNEWSLSDEWRMSDKDVFKTLKLLLLSGTNFKHWEASSDNFPNLKRLVLKKCRYLQQIPADFGEICTLESIELHDCSVTAEDSAKNIEREQEDMGNNILKVSIVDNNNWAVEIIDLLMSSSKCRMF